MGEARHLSPVERAGAGCRGTGCLPPLAYVGLGTEGSRRCPVPACASVSPAKGLGEDGQGSLVRGRFGGWYRGASHREAAKPGAGQRKDQATRPAWLPSTPPESADGRGVFPPPPPSSPPVLGEGRSPWQPARGGGGGGGGGEDSRLPCRPAASLREASPKPGMVPRREDQIEERGPL